MPMPLTCAFVFTTGLLLGGILLRLVHRLSGQDVISAPGSVPSQDESSATGSAVHRSPSATEVEADTAEWIAAMEAFDRF